MRRPSVLLLAALAATAVPALGIGLGRDRAQATILVASTVAENARRTMPPEVWQNLVDQYVYAKKTVHFTGSGSPTLADCRAARATYAVTARFTLAPRLPGFSQDPDRKYAMARVNLLDCRTGAESPERAIHLESEPLSKAQAAEFESNSRELWARAVHARLGKQPLELAGIAQITRMDGLLVFISALGYALVPDQVVRIFAGKDGRMRPPIELVVTEVTAREVVATFNVHARGLLVPQVGDYIEPLGQPVMPAASPSAH